MHSFLKYVHISQKDVNKKAVPHLLSVVDANALKNLYVITLHLVLVLAASTSAYVVQMYSMYKTTNSVEITIFMSSIASSLDTGTFIIQYTM